MKSILASWIGRTVLNAAQGFQDIGHGPIAQASLTLPFDLVLLLSDYPRFREQAEKLTAIQQMVALLARTLTNQELINDTGRMTEA